jgi:hypothetical protein
MHNFESQCYKFDETVPAIDSLNIELPGFKQRLA